MPTFIQMKTLQIKAEINKLGDANRAYAEKLKMDENSMDIDQENVETNQRAQSLDKRFSVL